MASNRTEVRHDCCSTCPAVVTDSRAMQDVEMGDSEQQAHSIAQAVPESASDADAMMDDDSHAPVASGSGTAAVGAHAGTIHAIHVEEDEDDDEDYNPNAPSKDDDESNSSDDDESDDGDGQDDEEALASGDEEVTGQSKYKRVNYKGM
ncbi:hypothetical protein PENSPDRAFT_659282 [Peniophora sp. CONT]|nr:hypothetical protein PENSPDRAFT_659282 [Peniophora sp. CONT]